MEAVNQKIRIWEIDVLRGIAFFFMILDHLIYDAGILFRTTWNQVSSEHFLSVFANWSYAYRMTTTADVLRVILASGVFLFVSGVSSNLSMNNVRRGLKLAAIAMALTILTFSVQYALSNWFSIRLGILIVFGILHCLAVCMLLTPLLRKIPNWGLIILAIAILAFGLYFQGKVFDNTPGFLIIFNIIPRGFVSADFYPIFPYLGLYIIGMVVGKKVYKEKKSLFVKDRTIQPFTFFGKNALWLYFVHQILLFVILYIAGIVLL